MPHPDFNDPMKRYRVFGFDLDSRSHLLQLYSSIKKPTELDNLNYQRLIEGIKLQYGEKDLDLKIQNLIDIGLKPISVVAYHNKFLIQIRNAFVSGAYYPALTGACALGERILNHLILNLRDEYKSTPEYKKVHNKKSFDNWDTAIETLTSWKVLQPDTSTAFENLKSRRNKSIHFNLDTEIQERQQAQEAITLIQEIVAKQFIAFGDRPWFITDIPGEIYLKSSWESEPFIQLVYLPNSKLVGYMHEVEAMFPSISIRDDFNYPDDELTDEEFSEMRRNHPTE